ncbi:hypothetical protein QQF64_036367, partial [Cirrhinus molitorella]
QIIRTDQTQMPAVSMKSHMSMVKQGHFQTRDKRPGLSIEVLRSNLKKRFERLYEGIVMQGNSALLNEIYTELYITESESGEISNEHEVRQIETQFRRTATEDTAIKCNDIFSPLPGQDKAIRTVLTKGVAGIGKTVSVQKFILDWTIGKKNKDLQLIFPLPFREINLMKNKKLSFSDFLHDFFPETKEMEISSDEYKMLFIFDGLDECRLTLDFQSSVKLCNISQSASVDVLLVNLIVGNLLPSALIWITSRPAAADLIPSECVHRVTEVRGFNDPQKEEYFRKRISDQSLANRIISHLKSSRSLFIMCHIPVFCWISAAVLEKMLSQAQSGKIPKTLTQMYTHFLILQTNIKHKKDYEKKVTVEDMVLKLGKLAFQQLVKGNLIFYEEDLRECGIDVTEASVYSGLCTQIFREELGLYQGKVFCFVHLSIQEHLAALYAHLSCTINKINVFGGQHKKSLLSTILYCFQNDSSLHVSLSELHLKAVDEALQSKNGHLDLFLRFLLGLSVDSNQTLLRKLLPQTGSCFCNKKEIVKYIKQNIRENHSPGRFINLFYCLSELGDDSLTQEVLDNLNSGKEKQAKLSSSQWSALVYVLLTLEQKMDVFDLKKFIGAQHTADKVLQNLLPVVKESRSVRIEVLRSNLKKRFERLYEGIAMQGNSALLNESESGEISNEHEVRQIETQSRRTATEDTAIKCNDIFSPLPGQDKAIRTVLTKGVAGIGKTVSVQKFILDWTIGKKNKDLQLIFPLPFRKINLMKNKKLSFSDFLHDFFPETKEMEISSDEYKMLFIFDGLDECRLTLDFQSSVKLCNISQSASVDVLLVNLIMGNLLPSALIWITSRPAAADLIPSECVHRVTEVRGFNDPQKEEYFRKRISDQSLADRIISHLKSSRSLFIMCHIPVFCWISATVLEKMLSQAQSGKIPKTLTQMYTHFLIFQTNIKHEKDYEKKVTVEDMVLKLGKLAFQQLVKGNLIFYEEDLRECGIDVTEASVYSGLCTQIFREELGLYQGKVFCFVHLSIQEHLAALYAHLSCTVNKINVFGGQHKKSPLSTILYCFQNDSSLHVSLSELHLKAVDEALQSKNGHLDLFLRFLLGLSVESNQTLLRKLLPQTGSCFCNKKEIVKYIKQNIRENHSPGRFINLFYCLSELGDDSLTQEVLDNLNSGKEKQAKLSSSQWSALVYVLLTLEQKMDVFDLKKFIGAQHTADKVLQNLLPVVKESRSVRLQFCNLTAQSCRILSSALQSSVLRELDLSNNDLQDSGVKLLFDELKSANCQLEILRLQSCNLTAQSCKSLSSALQSSDSALRELDLSNNDLQDSKVKLLSDGLKSPNCQLQILRMSGCMVTEEGCGYVSAALSSNPSHLRELDLSYNHPGDSGVKLLSEKLQDPNYALDKLNVNHGGKSRIAAGLKKYACFLTLDPNTAHTELILSENNRKVTRVKKKQPYPDHPDRFDVYRQVLSRESVCGRCYWEIEWRGDKDVCISVSYKSIRRKGVGYECLFGFNNQSWSLFCSPDRYSFRHNKIKTVLPVMPVICRVELDDDDEDDDISRTGVYYYVNSVGVYVDPSAGILSFYSISRSTMKHIHTVHTTFTQPLSLGLY